MIQGFHHIAIDVTNFDGAVDFYTTVLGFKAAYRWGDPGKRVVMIDTGNGNFIEFFEKPEVNANDGQIIHFS